MSANPPTHNIPNGVGLRGQKYKKSRKNNVGEKKIKSLECQKRDRKARNQGLSVGDSAQRCALCRNDVSHTGETGGKQMGGSHIIRPQHFFTAAHLFSPFNSHDGARHSAADVRRRRNLLPRQRNKANSQQPKAKSQQPTAEKKCTFAVMKNTGQDIRSFASQMHDQQLRDEPRGGYTIVLDPVQQAANGAAAPPPAQSDQDVPPRIYEMIRMYEYGNNSFELKCRNFYRQGKFMEDYEDDAPWEGVFSRYFPTYHDLNIRQLRGYFTWRTQVRKGIYRPISTSLAYIYLYELLNGIGTSSVEESLWKMQEFETEYLDSEIGDERMRHNLRRWMLELAVIHQLPKNTVNQYADPFTLEQDRRLEILRDPSNRSDEELFRVLCWFADRNLEASPVFVAGADSATHLFAEVWRRASEQFRHNGNDFFTACFGPLKAYHWYPLGNAVYLERRTLPESAYELTGCRRYVFHDGCWKEEKHDELYFDRKRVKALIHVTDLMLRRYLKTGRYLRENAEEAWAIPYVEAVIEADRQAKIEAARPKVHIHLENLAQIRKDAVATRDSLLTEEELTESNVEPTTAEIPVAEGVGVSNDDNNNDIDNDYNNDIDNDYNYNKDNDNATVKLEPLHRQILLSLLGGGTADGLLRTHRLMPAVVADSINEAFFDEIGDSILDCDGDRLSLVEDYVEDVRALLTN